MELRSRRGLALIFVILCGILSEPTALALPAMTYPGWMSYDWAVSSDNVSVLTTAGPQAKLPQTGLV
ncbi:hypothetical protein V5R04_04105 [Jonesiaceae bacterium BS-20]|uniref:Uncharacterized protein n=1 Tax=Jonesiaceae bacterium BS-20 TaxID=3120821 RepID=A0AAU7DYX9_9MICO